MKRKFTLTFASAVLLSVSVSAQWAQTTLSNVAVTSLESDAQNVYAGSPNGVHVTSDAGITFTLSQLGAGYNAKSLLVDDNTGVIYAGTTNGGVFTSTNTTMSWIQAPGLTYNGFAVSGSTVFAATSGAIRMSSDNGTTWTTGLTAAFLSMHASGTNVYAGGAGNGFYRSTNSGSTWTVTGLTNKYINAILSNNGKLFAGCPSGDGGLYVSSDNGTTWTQAYSSISFNALVASGNNIFAATTGGILVSTDNGSSWAFANSGLPSSAWDMLSLTIQGNYIYCGNATQGLWKRALSEMATDIAEQSQIKFAVFPNPATGKYFIRTEVPPEMKVEVYSSAGSLVQSLHNPQMIDISGLSAGVYFVKVYTEKGSAIQKFVLQ